MKKNLLFLFLFGFFLLLVSSHSLFSRELPRPTVIAKPVPYPYFRDLVPHYTPMSPLLLWGRFQSLNSFQFTGNAYIHFFPKPTYFQVKSLMTFEKGNVIYILPRYLKMPSVPNYMMGYQPTLLNSRN